MIRTRLCASLLLLLIAALTQVHAQELDRSNSAIPPRSPIVLLPKYKLEISKGVDTTGMAIWREGGFSIRYVQGMYIESDTDIIRRTKDEILWTQEQLVNKQKLVLTCTKSHGLFASFPALHASFSAKIHSQQDIADMLLMVVTF